MRERIEERIESPGQEQGAGAEVEVLSYGMAYKEVEVVDKQGEVEDKQGEVGVGEVRLEEEGETKRGGVGQMWTPRRIARRFQWTMLL